MIAAYIVGAWLAAGAIFAMGSWWGGEVTRRHIAEEQDRPHGIRY